MAAELFDPFEVVREEVQESVGRAEALAASFADPDDPWRQQGPSQAPRRNPYAKMLRREKGYYEHLARRLSRYLSALAD